MTAAVPVSIGSVLPVSDDIMSGAGAGAGKAGVGAVKAAAPAVSSDGGGGDAQPEVVAQSVVR